MKYPAAILFVAALAALGVADAAETTRLAVKIGGVSASYPAACRLTRARIVGTRAEASVQLPCVPLAPCGAVLVYRYEARAGSSSGLPLCPQDVVAADWR